MRRRPRKKAMGDTDIAVLLGRQTYQDKVLSMASGNLIGYWPMDEASGAVAYDKSRQRNNGAYTGVTLGQPGIGDGKTCPLFDGANDFNNIYSAGLNTDFDDDEFTVAGWLKVANAGIWGAGDGTNDCAFHIGADWTENYFRILKSSQVNKLQCTYVSDTTSDTVEITMSLTTWFHIAATITGTGDAFIGYLNGVKQDTTKTGLGSWVGALEDGKCQVGSQTGSATLAWNGWLANFALWTTPLTAEQIAYLAVV